MKSEHMRDAEKKLRVVDGGYFRVLAESNGGRENSD